MSEKESAKPETQKKSVLIWDDVNYWLEPKRNIEFEIYRIPPRHSSIKVAYYWGLEGGETWILNHVLELSKPGDMILISIIERTSERS